ncbi:hypothetical protein ACU4GD_25040 [Cupriavidus basilensis]
MQDPLAPMPFAARDLSVAPPAAPVARDLSVLAWLAPSLRAALDDAAAELGHYVDEVQQAPEALGARDTTSLRLAGQHLHQAAGAVHIVGLRGVDPYCQALRRLLEGIDGGAVAADAQTLAAFRLGVQALAEYVDDLMVGDDEDPVRLFCSYADVLGRLGEDRVHPADLWVDELQMLPGILLPTRMASTVTRARQRFEGALLKALRLPVPCFEPSLLREAYLPLESALEDVRASEQELRRATDHPDRGVWHVLALVFGALAHGLLPSDLLAKRLAGRAHLLLRQYLQGQVRVPQALLNDAVYLLVTTGRMPAASEPESAAVLVLRSAIRECLQAFRIDARRTRRRVPISACATTAGSIRSIRTTCSRRPPRFERAAGAGAEHSEWQNALAVLAEAAQPLAQPALQRLPGCRRAPCAGRSVPAMTILAASAPSRCSWGVRLPCRGVCMAAPAMPRRRVRTVAMNWPRISASASAAARRRRPRAGSHRWWSRRARNLLARGRGRAVARPSRQRRIVARCL